MYQSKEAKNKAIVLEAFDMLFNNRDYAAAEHFWSSKYVQRSAHIEPGCDGLFNFIKDAPASLMYEPGVIGGRRRLCRRPWTRLWNGTPQELDRRGRCANS